MRPSGGSPLHGRTPARPGNSVNSGAQCAGIGGSYKPCARQQPVKGHRPSAAGIAGSFFVIRLAISPKCARRRDTTSSQTRQRRVEPYGAQRLQPVAIGGKWDAPQDGSEKRKPLRWVATSCPSRSVVRRGSTVRVRHAAPRARPDRRGRPPRPAAPPRRRHPPERHRGWVHAQAAESGSAMTRMPRPTSVFRITSEN
jgi:hypothetical protein